MSRLLVAATLLTLGLGACVPASAPRSVPAVAPAAPRPSPVPLPSPYAATSSEDWRDRPATPGDWRYDGATGSDAGAGPRAVFGAGLVGLTCDRNAGGVVLRLPEATRGVIVVRTSSQSRTLTLSGDGTIRLAASDTLLDALAFSRGRFAIEPTGSPALVIPVQAEIGRVVEDCR